MTDKGRSDDRADDEEDRETLAEGASKPGEPATHGDFDLESLPGRRPSPAQKPLTPSPAGPSRRKLPEAADFFVDRPATAPAEFEATPTTPDAEPSSEHPSTEMPTREIDVERELPTIVGTFAAPPVPKATPDEAETLPEIRPPEGTGPPLVRGGAGTDATVKSSVPHVSPFSKGASRTARDPILGTAAARGTTTGAGPSAPHTLAAGQLLADRYELIERLGKGGMGEVWKAKHILLQGMRAIKVIKSSISRDPAFRQRFLQEGQTMMRVKHPGVVEVTDLDETRSNRELYMVMEYLKGRTVYDAVRSSERPLAADVRDAARILREIADGMQRIHDERIVHKDLKSDNVLLVKGDDGLEHPKVIDFGLAKHLGDKDAAVDPAAASSPLPGKDSDLRTTLSGTLAYMAPEQFAGEASSAQSDIYAFGVMAYEVFTRGQFPLPRGALAEYMKLHGAGQLPEALSKKRPDLDPRLAAIFDRCMAVKRENRPESFRQVAEDIQWWLDTPERERRRKLVLMSVGAAVALVGIAVWGVFFGGEKTASLSNLAFTGGGRKYVPDPGRNMLFLPGSALSAFEMTASINGKPGVATLKIDDRGRDVTGAVTDDAFVARADLSDLSDGEHRVELRPSPNASPSQFVVVVDRAPPVVRGASVLGAVATPDGVFTRSDAPVVDVDVGEPASGIAEVFAVTSDNMRSPGQAERGADRWIIKGTAPGDGKVELDVVVRDLAGNETKTHLAYVRDTKKPTIVVRDYFLRKGYNGIPDRIGAWVRSATSPRLTLSVDEAAEATASFDGAPVVVRRRDSAGDIEFDLPPIPQAGVPTKLVVRDAAGNENSLEFPVTFVPDGLRIMDVGATSEAVVKGDAGANDARTWVIVARSYPLGAELRFSSTRVRAADGTDVQGAQAEPVELKWERDEADGLTRVFTVIPGTFADGVYVVAATAAGDPPCSPLRVTIDSAPPVVESVRVEDRDSHAPIPSNGWALGPDVVVKAVVSDLSLRRIDLDETAPQEAVAPGRNTYTFVKRLDHEGTTTWTLALADAAGHPVERAVTVQGDWTVPTIERLDSPAGGAQGDDITEVVFKGRCSEANYSLVVEGLPDGSKRDANCLAEEFVQKFLLPPTDGPIPVRVVAVDPAGHRSAPKIVSLSIIHRAAVLPPEVTWMRGVNVKMEKVDPGDVVLAACAQPVAMMFLDRTEVTNAEYRAFLAATTSGDTAWRHPDQPKNWDHTPTAATWGDPKWNADDLPVVNVAYWDAYAFAKWSGRRLPTEAEWVKAAAKSKETGEIELRQWPPFGEGEEWRPGVLATSESVKGPVSALTGDDVSPVGCLHMGGNVSEWVEIMAPAEGVSPAGTRGGSWFFSKRAADVRNTPTKPWDRSFRANTIGFRCAVDADRVQP